MRRNDGKAVVAWGVVMAAALVAGCGAPDRVNVELRRENQGLEEQVAALQNQNAALRARIDGLKQSTLPSLPQERLSNLFTVHRIELGRYTGSADLDEGKPGHEGLKVYLTPTDEQGDAVKATGRVVVEAFDLSKESDNRVGQWEFAAAQLKEAWRGLGPLQAFVLECPWQTAPQRRELAIKVSFTDELTGRLYSLVREIQVELPAKPATQAGSRP